MARKPKRNHRAYKEWAPSVRKLEQNIIIITHGKINSRATINLKISILDSRTNHRLSKATSGEKTEITHEKSLVSRTQKGVRSVRFSLTCSTDKQVKNRNKNKMNK